MPIARSTVLIICTVAGLFAAAGPAGAARKPRQTSGLTKHAHYRGTTSQGGDITLQLSNDARRVAKLRINYTITCDNQASAATYTNIFNAPVSSHGFASHGVYTGDSDGSTNKFKIKGSLTRTNAHGTFTLSLTGKTSSGAAFSCTSGTLTWTARKS